AEDHLGDMDFKVAGTEAGVTALQMDIKITGVTTEILRNALSQAKDARLFILDAMREAIAAPRDDVAAHAPRIVSTKSHPDYIGMVIGKGGETTPEQLIAVAEANPAPERSESDRPRGGGGGRDRGRGPRRDR